MLNSLFGDPNSRKLKKYQPIVNDINILEEDISKLSDDELRQQTIKFKGKFATELDEREKLILLDLISPITYVLVNMKSMILKKLIKILVSLKLLEV